MPEQVEESVDDEVRDLTRERPARLPGLGFCRLHGDVDLAQEEIAVSVLEVAGLGEGKGKHVGGTIDLEKVAVQDAKVLVSGEHEGNRSPGKAQDPEAACEERPKSGRS